ncbi:hypothetical protein [Halorubrum ezzemoulense]|uniref:Uncharacterized protein n=1 Tax=Halorubrum ezzemoulense TaxID=337243 RepID=A0A256JUW1_HALEZ|nr:hypothetical protein [Halorubrum ezzemoulense]OYR72356.1 hypothetical protein DJ78_03105 [Halorubrum ezzemoulense]
MSATPNEGPIEAAATTLADLSAIAWAWWAVTGANIPQQLLGSSSTAVLALVGLIGAWSLTETWIVQTTD